jgi:hypothetical protein
MALPCQWFFWGKISPLAKQKEIGKNWIVLFLSLNSRKNATSLGKIAKQKKLEKFELFFFKV